MKAARVRFMWLALLVALIGLVGAPAGAAAVSWPVSSGLFVSEVTTGGASASDEFIEIYNASSVDVDLGGLELVYVTSSGSTVTRKQTWSALPLGAHRHLLIANSAGPYAAGADGTYSGGLSATGGSVVLRTLGGTVIDSLSWGDAASTFVEARAASAPPAGSSLERRPGAALGNGTDTNDNVADAMVNAGPVPQGLAAPPVPTLAATPSPGPTPTCAWAPMPTATPSPSPTFVASPTPSPTGAVATLSGQLITTTGLLDGGRTAYLDLGARGIALFLEVADWPALAAGTFVFAKGVLGERHGEQTLFLGGAADLVYLGEGLRPAPLWAATGLACEAFESRLIAVQGLMGDATVDDGTGPLNVVVPNGVVVPAADLAPGNTVELVGVLSQVEQTADGDGHYVLIITNGADVLVLSRPATPTPTTSSSQAPTTSQSPIPTASPTPTPTPTPSASPSPTLAAQPIADARLAPLGARVRVEGRVTVEPGRILGDTAICIQDESGGIYVRLPEGAAPVELGQSIDVEGVLAAPYGNLEIRPAVAGIHLAAPADLPAPRPLAAAELGEATEGLLARIEATVDGVEASSSGSLTLLVHDDTGATRVFFHAPLGASAASYRSGQRIVAVGLVGDRLGLYRLWPRDLADVTNLAEPPTPTPRSSAAPTATPRPTTTQSAAPDAVSIADALRRPGTTVSVAGTVTTRPGLLDADGRRVTIQDATGAILVRLPDDLDTQPGRRLSVSGVVGTYYGAPQLTAATAVDQGAAQPEVAAVRAAPIAPALEWRLVTVTGTVDSVHRDGEAWRAELKLAIGAIPIVGLERSGISSTALVAGRTATITGIVKRPYPSATDQRLAIVPRSAADIVLGAAPQSSGPGGSSPRPGSRPTPRPSNQTTSHPSTSAAPGSELLVGGSVTGIKGTVLVLADASGDITIELVGAAAPLAATLEIGDLVNARGTLNAEGRLIVDEPGALVRVAGLGSSRNPGSASPANTAFFAQTPHRQAAQRPQMAPVLAFGAIFGLTIVLVVGAFAVKLYGPNRFRKWSNRLKSRKPPI